MQGLTIALLMNEQLSQVRADSSASRREAAALELRRLAHEARSATSSRRWHRPEPRLDPYVAAPRIRDYPYAS